MTRIQNVTKCDKITCQKVRKSFRKKSDQNEWKNTICKSKKREQETNLN
jgi:hypothetical protein